MAARPRLMASVFPKSGFNDYLFGQVLDGAPNASRSIWSCLSAIAFGVPPEDVWVRDEAGDQAPGGTAREWIAILKSPSSRVLAPGIFEHYQSHTSARPVRTRLWLEKNRTLIRFAVRTPRNEISKPIR